MEGRVGGGRCFAGVSEDPRASALSLRAVVPARARSSAEQFGLASACVSRGRSAPPCAESARRYRGTPERSIKNWASGSYTSLMTRIERLHFEVRDGRHAHGTELGVLALSAERTRFRARVDTEAAAAAHAAYTAVKRVADGPDEGNVGRAIEARAQFERLAAEISPGQGRILRHGRAR